MHTDLKGEGCLGMGLVGGEGGVMGLRGGRAPGGLGPEGLHARCGRLPQAAHEAASGGGPQPQPTSPPPHLHRP